MDNSLVKQFKIDNKDYLLNISIDGHISFFIREIDEVYDGWEFGKIEYLLNTKPSGPCKHPHKVLHKLATSILEWVCINTPGYFYFETNDTKKKSVYEKLLRKYGNRILEKYYYMHNQGEFWFFRLQND